MRFIRLFLPFVFFIHFAVAQHRFDPVARSAGGVWIREGGDPWCVLGSAPLLASVSSISAGLAHFPSPWGVAELAGSAAVIAVPAGPGVLGASVTHSAFELYAETDLGVAYGAAVGALVYGVTARYRYLRIERYGSTGFASVDASVVITTGEWFRWGLRITDLNRPVIGNTGERVREAASVAAALSLPDAPQLLLEAERDGLGFFTSRVGIVHAVGELLTARFGMSGSFTRIHCGLEVMPGGMGFGYGVVVHPELGWSHSLWLVIALSTGSER